MYHRNVHAILTRETAIQDGHNIWYEGYYTHSLDQKGKISNSSWR